MTASSRWHNPSLRGKSALVTGGARRIGRQIALTLAQAGANVAITYRTSAEEAVQAVQEIQAVGSRAHALACDIRVEASVRSAVAEVAGIFGQLDILVNNAAIFATAPLDQVTLAQWDEVFATNTRGPFLLAREALPHLKAARGRILNIGSLGGLRAWATHGHYCASKAALHMLTQAQAKAFAPEVSVNCIAPGWVEFAADHGRVDAADASLAAHFAAKTPMRRNATAQDVADAALFFAAGPAFVTGQILSVDGGLGL